MCDAIAPVFMTNGMTQNSYFPEHVLPSANLLDYDVLGRLYDPAQWTHAFGPSQLVNPVPFSQSDAAKIWRASGRPGEPCASCNLVTGYVNLVGGMLQAAGPGFSPLAVEAAYVGNRYSPRWVGRVQGRPDRLPHQFGPDDYNAISDYREVYWAGTARSEYRRQERRLRADERRQEIRVRRAGPRLQCPAEIGRARSRWRAPSTRATRAVRNSLRAPDLRRAAQADRRVHPADGGLGPDHLRATRPRLRRVRPP